MSDGLSPARSTSDTDDEFDLVSGDWMYDEGRAAYRAYEGVVADSWSGGVEWIASRAVAEQIVRDQQRYYDEQKAFAPDLDPDECIARLEWDGDAIVQHEIDGETYRIDPADDFRNYRIGFGWTWSPVDADEAVYEIVRNDGTVEVVA